MDVCHLQVINIRYIFKSAVGIIVSVGRIDGRGGHTSADRADYYSGHVVI